MTPILSANCTLIKMQLLIVMTTDKNSSHPTNYQNLYQGLAEGKGTPSSNNLEKALAKSLKKASSSLE